MRTDLGLAHSRLLPPQVVLPPPTFNGPTTPRPVRATLGDARFAPHSHLGPPAVVGAGIAFPGPTTLLAPTPALLARRFPLAGWRGNTIVETGGIGSIGPGSLGGTALNFGQLGNEQAAVKFTVGQNVTVTSVTSRIRKSGAPADNVIVSIQADASGVPSGVPLASSASVSGPSLSTTFATVQLALSLTLAPGSYWVVWSRDGGLDGANRYVLDSCSVDSCVDWQRGNFNGSTWQLQTGSNANPVFFGLETSGDQFGSVVRNLGPKPPTIINPIPVPLAPPIATEFAPQRRGNARSALAPPAVVGAGIAFSGATTLLVAATTPALLTRRFPLPGWHGNTIVETGGIGSIGTGIFSTGAPIFGGSSNGPEALAVKFTVGQNVTVTSVTSQPSKTGAPTDNVIVSIQADAGGVPSGIALASAPVSGSSLPALSFQQPLRLALSVALTPGSYWVVWSRDGALNDLNRYQVSSCLIDRCVDWPRGALTGGLWAITTTTAPTVFFGLETSGDQFGSAVRNLGPKPPRIINPPVVTSTFLPIEVKLAPSRRGRSSSHLQPPAIVGAAVVFAPVHTSLTRRTGDVRRFPLQGWTGWGAIESTPDAVRDNFALPDGPLGPNWTSPIADSTIDDVPITIAGGRAVNPAAPGVWGWAVYEPVAPFADGAVFATVFGTNNTGLLLRSATSSTVPFTAYIALFATSGFIAIAYTNGDENVHLLTTGSISVAVGDRFRFSALGTTLTLEQDSGSGFAPVLQTVDSRIASGQIGMYLPGGDGALDSFGGGPFTPSSQSFYGFKRNLGPFPPLLQVLPATQQQETIKRSLAASHRLGRLTHSRISPPVVVAASARAAPPIATKFAPQRRGHTRSALAPPAVVGAGIVFRPVDVELAISKRGAPKSHLSPPAVVNPPFVAAPVALSLASSSRGKSRSILFPPAVVGAGIAFQPTAVKLAPSKRGKPSSRLAPPTIVAAGAVFRPLSVKLALSKRGSPKSHLSPPAVVGAGIYFAPVSVTLAPSTRGKTRSALLSPTTPAPPTPSPLHVTLAAQSRRSTEARRFPLQGWEQILAASVASAGVSWLGTINSGQTFSSPETATGTFSVPPGATLLAFALGSGWSSTPAVSASDGTNTYVGSQPDVANVPNCWRIDVPSGLSAGWTWTNTNPGNLFDRWIIVALTGVGAYDKGVATTDPATATPWATGSLTPSQNGSLLVAFVDCASNGGGNTATAPATDISTGSNIYQFAEYAVQAGAAPITLAGTSGNAPAKNSIYLLAFKPLPSGTPSSTVLCQRFIGPRPPQVLSPAAPPTQTQQTLARSLAAAPRQGRLPHSRLSPPTTVTPTVRVFSGPAVHLARNPKPRTISVLRRPLIPPLAQPITAKLAPQRRGHARSILSPPAVVGAGIVFRPVDVELAASRRGVPKSHLASPAVIGAGITFAPIATSLAPPSRGKPRSVLHPPVLPPLAPPIETRLATELVAVELRPRAPHSRLAAPTVVNPPFVAPPIAVALALSARGKPRSILRPPVLPPLAPPIETRLATELVTTELRPRAPHSRISPPTVVNPPFIAPPVATTLAPSSRGKPAPTLSPPAVIGAGIVFAPVAVSFAPSTDVPLRRRAQSDLRPPAVVQPIGTEFFGPAVHLAPSKRGAPRSTLHPPAVVGAGIVFAPLAVSLTPSTRGRPKSYLFPPIIPPLAHPVETEIAVQITRASRVERQPHSRLAPPAVVFTATELTISVRLAQIRPVPTHPRLFPPVVVNLATELTTSITLARIVPATTHPALNPPAVVGAGIVFAPVTTTLTASTDVPERRRVKGVLRPPTVVFPVTLIFFGPRVHLGYQSRGKPKSILRAPARVGAGIVFRPLLVVFTQAVRALEDGRQRRAPHSKLRPPAVVGAGIVFRPIAVRRAPSRVSHARSTLFQPAVVGAGIVFFPVVVHRAPSRFPHARSEIFPPAVVGAGVVFRPLAVHRAPSRFPRARSVLSPPTVVGRTPFRPLLVHLALSRLPRSQSHLAPPAVVTVASTRPTLVHLAPSRRGLPLSSLRPPVVVVHLTAPPLQITLIRIRPVPVSARLSAPTVVRLATELTLSVTLARIRPAPVTTALAAPTVIFKATELRIRVQLAPSARGKAKSALGQPIIPPLALPITTLLAPSRRGASFSRLSPPVLTRPSLAQETLAVTLARIRPPHTASALRAPAVVFPYRFPVVTTLRVSLAVLARNAARPRLRAHWRLSAPPIVIVVTSGFTSGFSVPAGAGSAEDVAAAGASAEDGPAAGASAEDVAASGSTIRAVEGSAAEIRDRRRPLR